ncbi:LysR family transcriptional regulator [Franconibacter daqui]|uniref:LysR family transcriptional regulator n=1 Tax=Franconibacter daqui TaxID=2047724 RepID=UPI002DB60A0D|nr:LysR family transcriptional regulator [Franconibacter daqui]MEB5924771.1 LysR family transcriptional regulator [Franconibacter daqui]
MDIRQLRMAVTLSKMLHFGKTAEMENIAQSGLSVQIAKLETELGFRIFQRSSNRVYLTRAGEKFIEHAVMLLSNLNEVTEECRLLSKKSNRTLRVGFFNDGAHEKIYPIISLFQQSYPEVRLHFTELGMTNQIQALIADKVDVALIRLPVRDERLHFDYVCEEPRVAAVPAIHELADAPLLSCADLLEQPFAIAGNGAPQEWLPYWSLREDSSTAPRIGAEVYSINESLAAVAYSGAFDTYPVSASRLYNQPGVRFIPLKDAPESILALASLRDNPSQEVKALRTIIRTFQKNPELRLLRTN